MTLEMHYQEKYEEGMEQGLKRGEELGVERGLIDTAKKLSLEEIALYSGLTLEQVRALQKEQ